MLFNLLLQEYFVVYFVKITDKTIEKVASLARLNLTSEEEKKMKKDLSDVLEAFDNLDKAFDVAHQKESEVEPAFQPIDMKDVVRADAQEECYSQAKALSNTKHKEKGFFKGPKEF